MGIDLREYLGLIVDAGSESFQSVVGWLRVEGGHRLAGLGLGCQIELEHFGFFHFCVFI